MPEEAQRTVITKVLPRPSAPLAAVHVSVGPKAAFAGPRAKVSRNRVQGAFATWAVDRDLGTGPLPSLT